MPFKWDKDRNPYLNNYFGTLRVGPNTSHVQIMAKARELVQKLASGQTVTSAGNHALDEHSVNEASTKLRDPRSAAEELLLVHPQPESDEAHRLKAIVDQLRKKAEVTTDRPPIALRDPLGVFWFLPQPGVEAADLPPWDALGLVGPADDEDLALDIVFDC